MSKPIIEVINISKKFSIGQKSSDIRHSISNFLAFNHNKKPEIWALKDVSFEVQEGEVFGLIGPNGSGKSTLLKILSRITYPTSGKAILRGRVSSLLEVGTGFHNELTGRENIYLNGSILGMKRAEIRQKFDEIVDFSGIEQFIDTPVKHYSSGMYVRLAFSVAAHLEPEILLVDEVLSVGDLEFRQKSMGKMNEVAKQGRTVIFVSHNLDAVGTLCNQGMHLNLGQLIKIADISEIIKAYNSKYKIASPSVENIQQIYEELWIDKFEIKDSLGNISNIFSCGDNLTIEIIIISTFVLKEINFRCDIYDKNLNSKFTINSYFTGKTYNLKKGINKIKFLIFKIPLNINNYVIDFGIAKSGNFIYFFQSINFFEIVQGNFYKSNNLPKNEFPFLIDHDFKIV